MKESGALSPEEFASLKAQILGTFKQASTHSDPPNSETEVVRISEPRRELERPTSQTPKTETGDHLAPKGSAAASTVASWLWVALCGVMAIGASGILVAVFFLVSGAMALPPLWRQKRIEERNVAPIVRFVAGALAFLIALVLHGSNPAAPVAQNEASVQPSGPPAQPQSAPATYEMDLKATPVSSNAVRFAVTTNLPLPVQIMADFGLAGLRDDETWIGYQEKVILNKPTSVFTLDASKSDRSLPAGKYDAEVSFYPRWGAALNQKAKVAPVLHARQTVTLKGSGVSPTKARLLNERQRWVMGNVGMHDPWDEAKFVARLGPYEKQQAELSHLHDAYYFPEADMTLIVNRLLGEVTIWRRGRASK